MTTHALIVDDDDGIRELLGSFLRANGYVVSLAENVASAEAVIADLVCDVVIIDIMMPNESGIDFLKRSRDKIPCPVIMLTALGDVDDRIIGLSSGANDYLAKPFEPAELLLRLRNLLNYSKKSCVVEEVKFGKFRYNNRQSVLYDEADVPISLTTNEHILMKEMLGNIGKIITREDMVALFPGSNERSIDTIVARLRSKIEVDSRAPVFLQTIRGQGYVFRV